MHRYFIRWEILIPVFYHINKVAIQYGVSIKKSDTFERKHKIMKLVLVTH